VQSGAAREADFEKLPCLQFFYDYHIMELLASVSRSSGLQADGDESVSKSIPGLYTDIVRLIG